MTIAERESLRAQLLGLGFDVVRFASAADVPAGRFAEWLAAGHHADMDWLARSVAKRLAPRQIITECASVIVLGVNYLPSGARAMQERWSKYALFVDYHDTIGRALDSAGALLQSHAGLTRADYRAYVDTGPILERGWAARAGLGWTGKNAMLISREHGNWLFLAVVLVRAAIPPDEPLPMVVQTPRQIVGQHCGTCTRCLTACPTAAFPEPGWVDARRCIAYHTIENRGVIPRELRAHFGGRVFGCDTCLDVCPWNRFARVGRSALLVAREEIVGLSLVDLLRMDEARFRTVFRRTPIKRTKLAGLLRNACIAAGNWHTCDDWHFGDATLEAVAAAVVTLCRHESSLVRAHAVWALPRLVGREEAHKRLAGTAEIERDECVREEYRAWA